MINPGASGYLGAQMMASFHPNAPTAEIGCGTGDRIAWLAGACFAATGFDTVIEVARDRHPEIRFQAAEWPDLEGVPTAGFDNVLCAGALDDPVRLERLS